MKIFKTKKGFYCIKHLNDVYMIKNFRGTTSVYKNGEISNKIILLNGENPYNLNQNRLEEAFLEGNYIIEILDSLEESSEILKVSLEAKPEETFFGEEIRLYLPEKFEYLAPNMLSYSKSIRIKKFISEEYVAEYSATGGSRGTTTENLGNKVIKKDGVFTVLFYKAKAKGKAINRHTAHIYWDTVAQMPADCSNNYNQAELTPIQKGLKLFGKYELLTSEHSDFWARTQFSYKGWCFNAPLDCNSNSNQKNICIYIDLDAKKVNIYLGKEDRAEMPLSKLTEETLEQLKLQAKANGIATRKAEAERLEKKRAEEITNRSEDILFLSFMTGDELPWWGQVYPGDNYLNNNVPAELRNGIRKYGWAKELSIEEWQKALSKYSYEKIRELLELSYEDAEKIQNLQEALK